ncbi:MAG: HIT domain-containing protein [Propionibacteriaceae bacterium]|nr:HIT domain-containing protein [Propionibacteriaceae bacterium]
MSTGAVPIEDGGSLAGVPDAFQRLWTPHRMVYIDGENKPADDAAGSCPFCRVPGLSDEAGLVVHRGEHVYAVMNLYPYSPGHLLLCPYRHISDFTEMTLAESAELSAFTSRAMTVLREVSHPAGFNLGINQGQVAGAGITAHLHQHVVPRWSGDSNFLPVIAQTRALPQLLEQSRQLLAAAWGTAQPDG